MHDPVSTDSSKSDNGCKESEKNTRQGEEDDDGDDEEDEDEDGKGEDSDNSTNSNESGSIQEDNVQAYAKEVMTLGLLCAEFVDSIRAGDERRVSRCWKFLILIYKAAQWKNYMY